jgi:microcystin-dependent protein
MSVTDLTAAADASEEPPAEDEAFVALLEKLRPVFGELIKVAVDASIEAVPTPTFKPGQVTNVNATTGIATVIVDGDTAPISAQVIAELPGVGDRVFVEFIPPATALVIGTVGGGGIPAGTVAFFAGPITADGLGADGSGFAPPRGWLRAKGGLYLAEQYPALFARIGTTYNTGGEATNPQQFRVPNLDDKFIRASGAGSLAATGGTSTITTSHLPPHVHDLASHTHPLSGSYSISGTATSDGTHGHGTNAHTLTGSGGVPVWDGTNGTAGFFYAPSSWTGASVYTDGAHTHALSGSVSLSGNTGGASGNTGNGPGASSTFLPPFITLHALIKA